MDLENSYLGRKVWSWLAPRAAEEASGAALVEAARRGDARAVRAQLAAGVGPDDARAANRQTALSVAAQLGHADVAEALLAAGADPIIDDVGPTPLFRAAFRGHHKIIELMAAARPEAFRTQSAAVALRRAALSGHSLAVRALLQGGVPVNASEDDFPSAMFAAATCDAACLRELLEAGADPDEVDQTGRTPLHHAAGVDDVDCVKVLVAAGADYLIEDDFGRTVYDVAVSPYMRDLLMSLPPEPVSDAPFFGDGSHPNTDLQ